ncbi:Hypothetical protein GL50581_3038 [Giardia duodenalis ATCC 50581]|uniref:RING-type domain-containing protein n=2 Tax=Giardia intestinalis TaxID=5741 RepID=C6LW80_GIAIB|nr:Hypothetical protein GL50581_3038 [Giardia intestinalis ATCC 50581]
MPSLALQIWVFLDKGMRTCLPRADGNKMPRTINLGPSREGMKRITGHKTSYKLLCMAVMERDNKIKQLEEELKDLREEKHPDNIETSMELDLLSEQLSITNEANNILRDQIQEMMGQQRHIADQLEDALADLEDARQRIECLVDESNRYFSQRQEYWDWCLERGERLIMMERVVTTLTDNPGEPDIDLMTEEETTCPICYDVLDRKGVRANKCAQNHKICFKCFSKMCTHSESLSCPLCRNQIRTETVLIE